MRSFKKTASAVIISVLIIISELLPGAFVLPAYAACNPDTIITEIFRNEKSRAGAETVQELLDGAYSEDAGVSSDWFVYSLMRYDSSYDYSSYIKSLKAFTETDSSSSSASKEKFALIFGAAGTNKSYISDILDSETGKSGIMSYIFSLHLLNNGFRGSKYYAEDIVDILLSKQLSDGGWALSGTSSDVDVTAMTIQALAPYYSEQNVKKAVASALSLLSDKQTSSGGFVSYGKENPESAAQVIVALASLGINPETDSDFIKNGKTAVDSMLSFKVSDGGYSHESGGSYNVTATSQVLYAAVSLKLLKSGGSLYIYNSSGAVKKAASAASASGSASAKSKTGSDTDDETETSRAKETTTKKKITTTSYSAKTTAKKVSSKKIQEAAKGIESSVIQSAAASDETLNEDFFAMGSVSDEYEPEITENTDSSQDDGEESYTETTMETTAEVTGGDSKREADDEKSEDGKTGSPKVYIISGIWALAVIAAVILLVKKNKKIVNFVIIAAVGGVLTVVAVFSNIESPADFYNVSEPGSDNTVTVTISITCDTVAGRGNEAVTPSDGVILPETEITLDEGSTVYDCLIKAAKLNEIQLEDNTQTLTDHTHAYIAGINNLYEFDYGDLSGWMYSVDGNFADVGCGEYTLSGGEIISWEYTCNLGDDLK